MTDGMELNNLIYKHFIWIVSFGKQKQEDNGPQRSPEKKTVQIDKHIDITILIRSEKKTNFLLY